MASLCLGSTLSATPDRTMWLWEQYGTPALATLSDEPRSQIGFSGVNYRDSMSFRGEGLLDLHALELGVQASQSVFLAQSGFGQDVRGELYPIRETLSADIGRYYVMKNGTYGALSASYLQFMPTIERYVNLMLQTGLLDPTGNGWALNLHGVYSFALQGADKMLVIEAETLHGFQWGKLKLEAGGFFSWTNRMRDLSNPGQFEYMLFSFGPSLRARTSIGHFRLAAIWRTWLDQYLMLSGVPPTTNVITQNMLEFTGIPDLSLSWTLPL